MEGREVTTSRGETTVNKTGITLQLGYVKTRPGLFIMAEIVINLLVIICASVKYHDLPVRGSAWVQFVAIYALITSSVLVLYHVTGFFQIERWPLYEFVHYCIVCFFYFITAIVAACFAHGVPSMGAAAFFAYLALVVYTFDTFFHFHAWRSGKAENPQRESTPPSLAGGNTDSL